MKYTVVVFGLLENPNDLIAQHAHYTLFYCNLLSLTASFCQSQTHAAIFSLPHRQTRQTQGFSSWTRVHDFSAKALCLPFSRTSRSAARRWVHMREWFNALSIVHAKTNHRANKISPYHSPLSGRSRYSPILLNSPFFFSGFFLDIIDHRVNINLRQYTRAWFPKYIRRVYVFVHAFSSHSTRRTDDKEDGLVGGQRARCNS